MTCHVKKQVVDKEIALKEKEFSKIEITPRSMCWMCCYLTVGE